MPTLASQRVILFGYGKFGQSVADTLLESDVSVTLVESDDDRYRRALKRSFARTIHLDVTDDEALATLPVGLGDQLVCVMDDDHLNVFLVLSLRALFPGNKILALSDSIHASRKLKRAGADQVIDIFGPVRVPDMRRLAPGDHHAWVEIPEAARREHFRRAVLPILQGNSASHVRSLSCAWCLRLS